MKLSKLTAATKENTYLIYLLDRYSKTITQPYMNFFMGRESNIDIVLSDKFQEMKQSVDNEIFNISLLIDSLDLDNLDEESLNQLGHALNSLATYMNYIKENKDTWNI